MILRSLYGSLYDLWKKGLRGYFLRVCAAFFLLALVFFGAGELFPSLQERLWKLINISMESAGVYTEDGTISAMNIFANNMMACFFVLLYGLVPFLRLGVQYLMYKLMAFLAAAVGVPWLSRLIDGLGGAFGLVLGMTGSCAVLLTVSVLTFAAAVTP